MGKVADIEKYYTTVGLMADVPGVNGPKLVSIAHERMTNGDWRVYAESARNMQPYHHTVKLVSKSDMQKVFNSYDSTYDSVAEFRALAAIVGVTL